MAILNSDGTHTDTQAKITAAVNGDTVLLPLAGTFVWTASVTMPATKGITLDLNGSLVKINGDARFLTVNPHATLINRVTNGKWGRGIGHTVPAATFRILDTPTDAAIVVDNITFQGSADCLLEASGKGKGLIHHCLFPDVGIDEEFLQFTGWGAGVDSGWTNTTGATLAGSDSLFYVEDCNFTCAGPSGVAWIKGLYGARFVVRHCVLDFVSIDMHAGGEIGPRWLEMYRNKFLNNTPVGTEPSYALSMRAGSGVIHHNSMSVGATHAVRNGFCEEVAGYPVGHNYKPGRGLNEVLDPVYVSNNASISTSLNDCDATAVGGGLVLGVDVIGSARPGYTEYVYPHPLNIGGGGGGGTGGVRELYFTTTSGVALYWDSHEPTTGTSWPAVILLHAGGFHAGANDPNNGQVGIDLAAAGFWALGTEYRLAPPGNEMTVTPGGHESPGQDTVSDTGLYPKQTQDVAAAVAAARADPRCNGKVYTVGGSAGAAHAVYVAGTGVNGGSKPDLCVGFSGPYDFGPLFVGATCILGEACPHEVVANYLGRYPDNYPAFTAADLLAFREASATTYLNNATPPIFAIVASDDSVGIDVGFNYLIQKLDSIGWTESTRVIPELNKYKKLIVPTLVNKHAFAIWDLPIDGVAGHQTAGQAVIAWLAAGPPIPGGTDTGIIRGTCIMPSASGAQLEDVLDDPNVDAFDVGSRWFELEPTNGVYDYTFIDSEIRRAAAKGKKVLIRISSMGGSSDIPLANGNTPGWVFTQIGNTPAGYPGSIIDATITTGSPTVTSPTAGFTTADLHSQIQGNGINPSTVYIGTVTNGTTIKLSTSPTAQVDFNATGTFLGTGAVQVLARPRASATTHDLVPGVTFTYQDPNPGHGGGPPETCIPVFWEPTFLYYKRRMINALGDHLTNGSTLSDAEKATVRVFAVSYANAQTEDFNIPAGNTIDVATGLTWQEMWLNSPTDPDPTQRGAGYTTQKMIDTAVKRADETFTDGHTFTDLRLTSSTANFTHADVGKQVQGAGIQANTFIAEWTSATEVQLSLATTATDTGVSVEIRARDTGTYDIALAAFAGRLVTSAINVNLLDADAALVAGDNDPKNYLVRTVTRAVNNKYPARCIAQKNTLTAQTPEAPGTGTSYAMLWEIHASGNYVAAQDLWHAFNDAAFRMNGSIPDDPTTILSNAANKIFGYGGAYQEIYSLDAHNLKQAIKYAHDLLNPGIIVPPPPPPGGVFVPPFQPIIRTVNFRDDGVNGVAALLSIDSIYDLPPAKIKNLISRWNEHVRYGWRYYPWPELTLTEERAYRRIWNSTSTFTPGDEALYLPNSTYYRCINPPPPGQIPPIDPFYWTAITLTDFYIAADQPCRMAIGEVYGVYDRDPRTNSYILGLDFRPSSRGIDVRGGNGVTAFVKFKIRPSRFTHEMWSIGTSYKPSAHAVYTDGNCYVALTNVITAPPTDRTKWMLVPMPEILLAYTVNRTAADMVQDVQTSGMYRLDADTMIKSEVDRIFEAGGYEFYDYSGRGASAVPLGVSTFWWSVSPPYAQGGSVSTLSDVCLDQWGNVIA